MSKLGELKEILKKLIAIPSVTGNEHDIAIYIFWAGGASGHRDRRR